MHLAVRIPPWHLLMHDARACRHPLHRARAKHTAVPQAIPMLHLALQHIGNRLNAAMRMPRKALLKRRRIIISKIIKQQKRVTSPRIAKAENPVQMHPCPLHRRLRTRL